jgi:hypothetical protein
MSQFELGTKNFRRILKLNWLIAGPIIVLFSWPYVLLGHHFGADRLLVLIGAFFFSLPFCLTIISGHISVAVGPLHTRRFFEWQQNLSGMMRFAFHPVMFTTYFRLSSLGISLIFLFIFAT